MTNIIDTAMLKDPDLLTKEEIEQLLPILDELNDWTAKVKDYALQQALNGEEYAGYKVVEGKTNRKIDDEQGAASARLSGQRDHQPHERAVQAGAAGQIQHHALQLRHGLQLLNPPAEPHGQLECPASDDAHERDASLFRDE